MTIRITLAAVALWALSSFLMAPADAQGRRLVFEEDEEDVIRGEVQKPSISILVTRQNLSQDYTLELRKSFVPEIVKSIEKRPF
jgi:hypothetical protein